MPERPTLKMALSREQQLAVLAATGLLVHLLELDLEELDEGGAATTKGQLQARLVQKTPARGESEEVSDNERR